MYSLEGKVRKTSHVSVYWDLFWAKVFGVFNEYIVHYRYRQHGAALFVSQSNNNTCSQHVKTSCYFDGFTAAHNRRFEL